MNKSTGRRIQNVERRSQRSGRQGQLRLWLENEIADGRLRPGERIDEKSLCERFDVSRTPVREAFLQLASVGLVTFRPRQGAVVAKMSVKEVIAMWEVLTGLEGLCAELAARRMPRASRAELAAVHKASKALLGTNDVAGYDEANRRLHELIYDGSQNEYLAQHVKHIRRRLQVYRRLPFERPGGIERSFDGHEKVVQAILAGDDKAAHSLMKEHVAGGLTFLDFVAELTAATDEGQETGAPTGRGAPVARSRRSKPAPRSKAAID